MAVFSTLRGRSGQEKLAHFTRTYANHRPLIQRVLNISFAFYFLGTTLYGLSGGKKDSRPRKEKGKTEMGGKSRDGRSERVAVLLFYIYSIYLADTPHCNR
jgi:ATP-binding cassette subfamily D (ALD) long-chain fatty acid import protein